MTNFKCLEENSSLVSDSHFRLDDIAAKLNQVQTEADTTIALLQSKRYLKVSKAPWSFELGFEKD